VRVINTFSNTHPYAFKIFDNFVVPETQHAVALTFKVMGSCCVRCLLHHMLATIQFNHQALFRTAEVDNVTSHRVLATELHAMQLPAPQVRPQQAFNVGLRAT
jgi:hypothetical protein